MPGGFRKKFGTASWGMTGTSVARAFVCAASGSIPSAGCVRTPAASRIAAAAVNACFMAAPAAMVAESRPTCPGFRRRSVHVEQAGGLDLADARLDPVDDLVRRGRAGRQSHDVRVLEPFGTHVGVGLHMMH